jgi:hypothetical protein
LIKTRFRDGRSEIDITEYYTQDKEIVSNMIEEGSERKESNSTHFFIFYLSCTESKLILSGKRVHSRSSLLILLFPSTGTLTALSKTFILCTPKYFLFLSLSSSFPGPPSLRFLVIFLIDFYLQLHGEMKKHDVHISLPADPFFGDKKSKQFLDERQELLREYLRQVSFPFPSSISSLPHPPHPPLSRLPSPPFVQL